ncbi:MAG: NAD(P)H-dependent glycerol-3-phosphate dehydrogenase [Dehalococcoidales bacterium]|jgi:glycerol-3-phosphate dehydrogenase (NAD(P)+)
MNKVAIIGTTTWGITLAIVLARKGISVRLWARTEEEACQLAQGETGKDKLAGVTFPENVNITSSIEEALDSVGAVVMVVPSQTMRQNIKLVRAHLSDSVLVVSASKGIEIETGQRMSEVISEEIDPLFRSNICVLSGPNLYAEVLQDLPAVSVVAGFSNAVVKKAQKLLNAPNFCVYTNSDIIGVELGGSLKNIIALGAGMVDGLGYGDNAKAALITRGLTEISALGVALGASPFTFSGLAGLGDLVATCASPLSRNHYVGEELAKGRDLQEILASLDNVAEGVTTTVAAWKLAKKLGLEMPITEKIYNVLYDGVEPGEIIVKLLGARGRHELVGRKWRLFSIFRRVKKK